MDPGWSEGQERKFRAMYREIGENWPELTAAYNRWAMANGLKTYTKNALYRRAQKHGVTRKMGAKWSEAEHEFLIGLLGEFPIPMAVQRYNQWATRNGFQWRTQSALRHRAHELGYSATSTGEWVTAHSVEKMLGIGKGVVSKWVARGWLPGAVTYKGERKFRLNYVPRTDLQILAKHRPQVFAGIEEARLVMVLSDEALAAAVVAYEGPRMKGRDRPVVRVDDGKRFPSVQAAANAVYVTASTLKGALREGHRAGGYQWRDAA